MNKAKTVVLIHGHGVDATIWDELHRALIPDYQVIRPDFSSLPNHETIEAYAEDVYRVLQAAQVEKAVLIGHSMGGYIALAFAEHYPDRVSGIVLFHSTVFADDAERKAKRKAAIEQIQQQGSAAFVGETVPRMFAGQGNEQTPEVLNRWITAGSRLHAPALIAGVKAIAARPDRSHVLRTASFPVMVIAGKEDAIIPYEKSREMADLLNDKGEFVTLEGAGHLGMIEQPAESLALLRSFLVKV